LTETARARRILSAAMGCSVKMNGGEKKKRGEAWGRKAADAREAQGQAGGRRRGGAGAGQLPTPVRRW
jgi:hypothetical protein